MPPAELAGTVGLLGRVTTVELGDDRLRMLREAVARIAGDESGTVPAGLADYCPDPLVFALESGLPRVRLLDRVIDGGSEWVQSRPVATDALTAVPRISEIAERTTSAGRRIIRTCYETEFRDAHGVLVGWARGFSLDVSVSSSRGEAA